MKSAMLVFICLLLSTPAALAESRYITDQMEITVRTGPGTDRKIIAMAKSAEKDELLEAGQEWSLVRLPDGKEGWVISRFLSSLVPVRLLYQQLQEKHTAQSERNSTLEEENKSLSEENRQLAETLQATQSELTELKQNYDTLKNDSAEFLKIKSEFDRTSAQLTEQTEKSQDLERELSHKAMNHNIKWFLAGAGVLIVGILVGMTSKRQRRRSSLL